MKKLCICSIHIIQITKENKMKKNNVTFFIALVVIFTLGLFVGLNAARKSSEMTPKAIITAESICNGKWLKITPKLPLKNMKITCEDGSEATCTEDYSCEVTSQKKFE